MQPPAFAYLRVSGTSQVEGTGFNRQERTIRAWAETHGFEIVRVFREEGISGEKDENGRPAFREMMGEILRNGVETVIIEGLDRLARSYRIQETLLIYLASKGIHLISAQTNEDVTEAITGDPMKKALIQMQGVFSELEKGVLVKKLKAARDKLSAEKGRRIEGRKPLSETAPEVLAAIKRLRRKPKNRPRMKYRRVAEELNRLGYKTANGTPFTPGTVQQICFRE